MFRGIAEDAINDMIDRERGRGENFPESEVPGVTFVDGAWKAARWWENESHDLGIFSQRVAAESAVIHFNKHTTLTGYGVEYGG
jgi:hypothetical protein